MAAAGFQAAIRSISQAPASPAITAIGGATKTKWRMPLYIAGRVATVRAIGKTAASASMKSTARRCAGNVRSIVAAKVPANPHSASASVISGNSSAKSCGT
jgi:hypothetical protein